MPTLADQRLLELLDKWLESLDLHLRYSSLDDETYWKIQPWVEHQRPSRWIIDLARQKTLALRKEVGRRIEAADASFSDSLELMTFLANLVGSQHIERFIPLADPQSERYVSGTSAKLRALPEPEATREMPVVAPPAAERAGSEQPTATQEMLRLDQPATAATATREMPRFAATRPAPAPPPVATQTVARAERRESGAEESARRPAQRTLATSAAGKKNESRAAGARTSSRGSSRNSDAPPPVSPEMCEQIIADAARLMQWGRKWYELAELISRMADRPPLPDVRRVLKDQKSHIEKLAGR